MYKQHLESVEMYIYILLCGVKLSYFMLSSCNFLRHFFEPLFVIFTVHTNVLLSHCSASSLPNITVRFPCQQFLGDYSGALVWKLRKCVIAEDVGGEEELCVWRDAQRKRRVGCRDVYKEEEELGGAQTARLAQASLTHTLRTDWKKEATNRISQIILSS